MDTLQEIVKREFGLTDEDIALSIEYSDIYNHSKISGYIDKNHFKDIKVIEYTLTIEKRASSNDLGIIYLHRGNPNYGLLSIMKSRSNEYYVINFTDVDYVQYIKSTKKSLLERVKDFSINTVECRLCESNRSGLFHYDVDGYLQTLQQMNDYVDLIKNTIPFSNNNQYTNKEVVFSALYFTPSRRDWSRSEYYNKEKQAILGVIKYPTILFISKGKNGKYIIETVNFHEDRGTGYSCKLIKTVDFMDKYMNKRVMWDDMFTNHRPCRYEPPKFSRFWFISRDIPEEILNELRSECILEGV